MWSDEEISFSFEDDGSPDSTLIMEVHTPAGVILIIGDPEADGRSIVVHGVHIQGLGIGANSIGMANLRVIADAVLKGMDYDEIIIEGGVRTTGANPDRRPRALRFTRRDRAPPGAEPG